MKTVLTKIPQLPERIAGLAEIATNLSWSWNRRARALFASIDLPLWRLTRHNPIAQLQRVESDRLEQCAADPDFLAAYDSVTVELARERTGSDTWFAHTFPELGAGPVAYFSAEFGLHNSVPIYSGGLGILAGDHCKASSDLGVPLIAVGPFYTKGYFDQQLRLDGWQEDSDDRFDPSVTPIVPLQGQDGKPFLATLEADGRTVHVGAWQMKVGRVSIYLLDTDLNENHPDDRQLLHQLYSGGVEHRLRQEWILGVGGVRVLRSLEIEPSVWHANEGHAAFMPVERVRELTEHGATFEEAVRQVRAAGVFTTHTPVPAGHDTFSVEQIEYCTGPIWKKLKTTRAKFVGLGYHPDIDHGRFHMTAAAIRLSGRVNGVARKHGEVTRQMWQCLWPAREPGSVPVGHVTNGVHLATWMSNQMMHLLDEHLGADWGSRLDQPGLWDGVLSLDDEQLWSLHARKKVRLLQFIDDEARRHWRDHWQEASHLVGAGTLLNPDALTIGFARRFATYKRANLIFRDPDRLRRLLIDPWRPVQFIFAGKAHPADEEGKRVLQQVYSFTRDSQFEGRIAFLEDYDMHMAHRLVEGVDLWLNLPRVPLEACGTSGMKAALNGVPHLGTADGWWAEGFNGANGWSIPDAPVGQDVEAWDAEQFYQLLESDVIPLFYERDKRGVPTGWVERMKHALAVAGACFTGRQMVQRYTEDFYVPVMRGKIHDDPPTV
ncbi:MAG: alpha-glucan family phosphorylase [Gemmatimonadota bacterium]|nr:MAG: alpha-glucan family phosphorylase [Gemmatimonadota bacterium]